MKLTPPTAKELAVVLAQMVKSDPEMTFEKSVEKSIKGKLADMMADGRPAFIFSIGVAVGMRTEIRRRERA